MDDRSKKTLNMLTYGYESREKYKEISDALRVKGKNFEEARIQHAEMLELLERVVHLIRDDNKEMRAEIQHFGDNDAHIIREALKDDRRNYLALNRSTFDSALCALNDKSGTKGNIANILRYIHSKNVQKIDKMEKDIVLFQSIIDKCVDNENDPTVQKITEIGIEIESINSRKETAEFINSKYRYIVEKLDEENRQLPQLIHNMELSLVGVQNLLSDVSYMYRMAIKDRDYQNNVAKTLEKDMIRDREARDEMLINLRKDAAAKTIELERLKKRKQLVLEDLVEKSNADAQIEKLKTEIFKYTEIFESIKSGTLVAQVKDVIESIVNSDEINFDQRLRKVQLESKRKTIWNDIDRLTLTLEELKFLKIEKETSYEMLHNEMKSNIEIMQGKLIKQMEDLKDHGQLLMEVRKGIDALEKKLEWIQLTVMPATGKSDRARLMNIQARIQALNEIHSNSMMGPEVKSVLACNLFMEKMEEFENRSHYVPLVKAGSYADLQFGIKDNLAMSREEIKSKSKQIVMANQKWGSQKKR